MICVGNYMEVKNKLEELIESRFPRRLSVPDIIKIANEYEMMLSRK